MKYRVLGRTGLKVSEIGFGTWGIGNTSWIGATERGSVQALLAAAHEGVNFFDTAPVYGRGQSERLLARVFGDSPEVIIASKVPPHNGAWPAVAGIPIRDVFPAMHVLECLHRTLRNLQREVIDLYQFHVWSDEWARDPEWLSLVATLKQSGMVRFIGISVNDHQPENCIQALESGQVDVVQVIYNIFDQSAEDHLLPYCAGNSIGVIARVPFDEGSLTGNIRPDTAFPAGDFRNAYFRETRRREVWSHVQSLVEDLGIDISQMPNVALRFCLAHPAVSTVIAGMRTAHHVQYNAAAAAQVPLLEDVLTKLHAHRWERNFYAPPRVRNYEPSPDNALQRSLRYLLREGRRIISSH